MSTVIRGEEISALPARIVPRKERTNVVPRWRGVRTVQSGATPRSLSLEQFEAYSAGATALERRRYAQWVGRRVLTLMEDLRKEHGRSYSLGGGYFYTNGRGIRSDRTLARDARLVYGLEDTLRGYGCPEEHITMQCLTIRERLSSRWKLQGREEL